jgi:hypothetical protein
MLGQRSSSVPIMTTVPADERPGEDVEITIDIDEDFSTRIRIVGRPEDVIRVTENGVVAKLTEGSMQSSERARMRRQFFGAAHVVVFTVAFLSIAGMVAHFLNIRHFDTTFLASMGAWTLGTIIYVYFVIVKDVFGLKTNIPRPPKTA